MSDRDWKDVKVTPVLKNVIFMPNNRIPDGFENDTKKTRRLRVAIQYPSAV